MEEEEESAGEEKKVDESEAMQKEVDEAEEVVVVNMNIETVRGENDDNDEIHRRTCKSDDTESLFCE
jgi:hypothetical protein